MSVQHFVLTAGEDRTLALTAKDRDAAIFNLTGATITFDLIDAETDQRCFATKSGTITSATEGTYTVTLTDTDTRDMRGLYRYIAKATISGATTAIGKGRIRVESDGERHISDYGQWRQY